MLVPYVPPHTGTESRGKSILLLHQSAMNIHTHTHSTSMTIHNCPSALHLPRALACEHPVKANNYISHTELDL